MKITSTAIVRPLSGLTALVTGLTAGMFSYGALNVAPAFRAVPLDVRLTFHTALMSNNAIVMQAAMGVSIASSAALAVVLRGRARVLAAAASVLGVGTFAVTRSGNVPINRMIREWIASGPPANHAEILARWEIFHTVRTGTAIGMFVLVLLACALAAHDLSGHRHGS